MTPAPLRILGIDPGSRITGYGVLELQGKRITCLDAGCIRLPALPLELRLPLLFTQMRALVVTYDPQEVAVEEVFMHKYATAALVLGHARGVVIAAAMLESTRRFCTYPPRQVKQAVVGTGKAEKEQVAYIVKNLLRLSKMPTVDATDALAVALCHAHYRDQPVG